MAKYIKFEKADTFLTADVILVVAENPPSPSGGITPGQMRRRERILDALEKAKTAGDDGVVLEDADHTHLAELVENFQSFSTAKPALLHIIDAIVKGQDVPSKPDSNVSKLRDKKAG